MFFDQAVYVMWAGYRNWGISCRSIRGGGHAKKVHPAGLRALRSEIETWGRWFTKDTQTDV